VRQSKQQHHNNFICMAPLKTELTDKAKTGYSEGNIATESRIEARQDHGKVKIMLEQEDNKNIKKIKE